MQHRYRPYLFPIINKKIDSPKRSSTLEKLRGIKLEGDVDELRLMLSEQPSIMERSVCVYSYVELLFPIHCA